MNFLCFFLKNDVLYTINTLILCACICITVPLCLLNQYIHNPINLI